MAKLKGFDDANFDATSKMKLNDVIKLIILPFGLDPPFPVPSLISEFFSTDCISISTFGRILLKTGCLLISVAFILSFLLNFKHWVKKSANSFEISYK